MKSEAQKKATRKWDRENMRSVTCRMRKEDAEAFKEFCANKGTTPAALIKEFIMACLNDRD